MGGEVTKRVKDLTVDEFTPKLMIVADEDEDGKIEWEEFWVIYKKFFTEKEAKAGAARTASMVGWIIGLYLVGMLILVVLLNIDFDGDGQTFLTIDWPWNHHPEHSA